MWFAFKIIKKYIIIELNVSYSSHSSTHYKIERKENAYSHSYQFFYYLLGYVGFSKSIIKERKNNIKENDFFHIWFYHIKYGKKIKYN